MTKDDIDALADAIADRLSIYQKEFLTVEEASRYTGLSKRHIYTLTSAMTIGYYKPGGKICYIRRRELDEYMATNRVLSDEELSMKAMAMIMNRPDYPRNLSARKSRKKKNINPSTTTAK